ncbi:cyclin-D4-2-like isoform X2 [Camellia sinensis]|uniref:cyclin-D4-2-like isoform X2 n=1 Tax=Camellia sinensis TaxID=4442 RepID=UPI0010358169|nr:cyclin-D4-2-like isoform X2 [Camellia sinensis]
MAPSFDFAVSSLLCTEDNSIIFGDDEIDFEPTWHNRNHRTRNQNQSFDEPYIVLPMQSDECLAQMLKRECELLLASDYLSGLRNGDLNLMARREAVIWIGKKGKAWMAQLLAVACLSLAAKMEETEIPLCVDFQVAGSKFVFEARTIQRMELLVLSTLKWRMQAVTPFSFIVYFLWKINGDKNPSRSSISRSTQLILGIIKGIDFLEFRPSEVAAAVAMSVAEEAQTVDINKAISLLIEHVDKERMLKCVDMIHELSSLMSESTNGLSALVPSVPQSPIGVLDAACLSYKTDDTTVGSCANSSHNNSGSKRRKLN